MDGSGKQAEMPSTETRTEHPDAGTTIGFGHSVVIGVLTGVNHDGKPLVAFPGNPTEASVVARSTCTLSEDDFGREVALLFEGGDPGLPLIIGPVHRGKETTQSETQDDRGSTEVTLDGERVCLSAEREIVLRCGKASITLTRAGKILIRGAYLSNRSSGVNRSKGGSVQIN